MIVIARIALSAVLLVTLVPAIVFVAALLGFEAMGARR